MPLSGSADRGLDTNANQDGTPPDLTILLM